MWRYGIVIGVVLLTCSCAFAHSERYYQDEWCIKQQGVMESKLDDHTRIDCLTIDYAVEVEFAHKFYESIGQSLHYAMMTGKKAAILIVLQKSGDSKYVSRLLGIIQHYSLPITVFVYEEGKDVIKYNLELPKGEDIYGSW